MGWLKDLWDGIVAWVNDIIDTIASAIRDWVLSLLALLRYWKHLFLQKIAEWMQNDLVFLGTVAALVVGMIYLPKLAAWVKGLTLYMVIKKAWEALKDEFRAMFDVRRMIDWALFSQMLKIIWPQYREATNAINAALAAWAEELGQGSGFIHAYMACAFAIHQGAAAAAGFPPEAAALEWYDKAAERTKLINERFLKYARNPELIYLDIMEEWLIPTAQNEKAANDRTAEIAEDRYKQYLSLYGSFITFKEAVDDFVEAMPEELKAVFEARWSKLSEDFDEAFKALREEYLDKFEEIVEALKERDRRLHDMNMAIIANTTSPTPFVAGSEGWSPEEQELWAEFVYSSVLQKRGEEQAEGVIEAIDTTDKAAERIVGELSKYQPTPVMSYESPGLVVMAETAEARKEDWFVGEF